MYELLIGVPPYFAYSRDELYDNIKRGPLKIPKTAISDNAKDLIIKVIEYLKLIYISCFAEIHKNV